MREKSMYRGLKALVIGAIVSVTVHMGLAGPAAQACACEGEEPGDAWMQNLASWGFAAFLIGIFVLSMVLFTVVMIRNSKRKQ